jgi:3-deoxy-manno-octulosonate cytidylyltransferase (CMP-KDO synthetase)
MNISIIIPARYGSSRFPGKPLELIAGRSMLSRTIEAAREACDEPEEVIVTTEDARIADHASEIGVRCIMTDEACETGSDRVMAAARQMETPPDFIINLQGDAPFTPPEILQQMMEHARGNPESSVITPVHQLSWEALDLLRESKAQTPFSGTTAVMNETGKALWFSKTIIPAMRHEDRLREAGAMSPVYQHIGLYGYRRDVLERFCAMPPSRYEALEGLEQLRFLENGIDIQCITVDIQNPALQGGIDTPEDIARVEAILGKTGDAP